MRKESIKALLLAKIDTIKDRKDLEAIKRAHCKLFSLDSISNSEILEVYQELLKEKAIKRSIPVERVLRKRAIRTLSGIAPVAVLTKPYHCPGLCVYCPRQEEVPVSYLSNEPAVMRAIRCSFNPYRQVIWRLQALEINGHEPNKIELIVIGGTWSYLPKKYKYWYILNCFTAANNYPKIRGNNKLELESIFEPYQESLSLAKIKERLAYEQKRNEKADYKIIGLTLETRPDYINENELKEMRELGCTRIEIGVQAIDDEILNLNQRGHDVATIIEATRLMKSFGFKITYHLMPALPGSNPAKDLAMYQQIFSDENFQPDQIKFYPTVVVAGSLLYKWHQAGKYIPYSDKQLQDLIVQCKAITPRYVRIMRLIRDIPGESIIAGNKITNLRQVMSDKGTKCNCIRCREVGANKIKDWQLSTYKYKASQGEEYFISIESKDEEVLYGFCRLRLDKTSQIAPAIIRELHVYGQLTPLGESGQVQHLGLGKKLIKEAEKISKKNKANKLAVISGIGVRDYYRKLGFRLSNTYLVKKLI